VPIFVAQRRHHEKLTRATLGHCTAATLLRHECETLPSISDHHLSQPRCLQGSHHHHAPPWLSSLPPHPLVNAATGGSPPPKYTTVEEHTSVSFLAPMCPNQIPAPPSRSPTRFPTPLAVGRCRPEPWGRLPCFSRWAASLGRASPCARLG
jgi:hypothetical protein